MTEMPMAGEAKLATQSNERAGVPEVVLAQNANPVSSAPTADAAGDSATPASRGRERAVGADPDDQTLVDQGGRPLGPRAQQTRARILDATVEILDEKPLRDLRVIDIARRIGSSPATFYQYFKDVEDVILHLASRVSEFTPEIVELIQGDWSGPEGHKRGRRLAEVVINHWDRYAPILRVRNNASDEGDLAFREVRMKAMMPMVAAFSDVIERSHAAGGDSQVDSEGEWEGGRVDPMYGAMALTSVLERLSMYHVSLEEMGGPRENLVETVATLLQLLLTSKR